MKKIILISMGVILLILSPLLLSFGIKIYLSLQESPAVKWYENLEKKYAKELKTLPLSDEEFERSEKFKNELSKLQKKLKSTSYPVKTNWQDKTVKYPTLEEVNQYLSERKGQKDLLQNYIITFENKKWFDHWEDIKSRENYLCFLGAIEDLDRCPQPFYNQVYSYMKFRTELLGFLPRDPKRAKEHLSELIEYSNHLIPKQHDLISLMFSLAFRNLAIKNLYLAKLLFPGESWVKELSFNFTEESEDINLTYELLFFEQTLQGKEASSSDFFFENARFASNFLFSIAVKLFRVSGLYETILWDHKENIKPIYRYYLAYKTWLEKPDLVPRVPPTLPEIKHNWYDLFYNQIGSFINVTLWSDNRPPSFWIYAQRWYEDRKLQEKILQKIRE